MATTSLILLTAVLGCAIIALAIYEHVSSSALSLPIAPGLTVFVIVLPIVAIANALVYYVASQRRTVAWDARGDRLQRRRALPWRHLPSLPDDTTTTVETVASQVMGRLPSFPVVLQFVQAAATVASATLFVSNSLADTPLLQCALETKWQHLYSAHDAAAVRRIQDALECCGFNSLADRAWPFTKPQQPGGPTCAESFGRVLACRGPWVKLARRRAGVELSVVVLVALFQATTVLLAQQNRRRPSANQERNQSHVVPDVRRPLLDGRRQQQVTGGDNGDEEEDGSSSEVDSAQDIHRQTTENGGGGNVSGRGTRVEPSHFGELRNEWNDV